jgi:hypothetical protein
MMNACGSNVGRAVKRLASSRPTSRWSGRGLSLLVTMEFR